MTRIANLAQFDRSIGFIQEAQRKAADLQTQIGSGKKAQELSGIARDSVRLLSLEATHMKTTQYVDGNKLIELRLQSMEGAVSQVFDIASSFKTLLVNGLNAGTALDLNMNEQAQNFLEQTSALLNTREDGRYLFAGTATATAPVDLTALPVAYTVPTSDGDASAYYQGNAEKHTLRADDNYDVSYGVTADAPGFERLIRALDVVVKGAPSDTAMLEHALELVNQAVFDIPTIRTEIGLDRTTLTEVNTKHSEFLLFTEQSISEIENVDLAEAATLMSQAQVTLDASYLMLSRLSQTSLLNFLR